MSKARTAIHGRHVLILAIVLVGVVTGAITTYAALFAQPTQKVIATQYSPIELVKQLDDTTCSPADTYTDVTVAVAHADTACALTISFENISELPASIGQLQHLREFRSRGNQIVKMPPEFWQLRSLRLLDVMDSDFADLSSSIGNLSQLQKLEVGGTHITTVPAELNKLHQLEFFDIMDTPIKSLPSDMSGLKNLYDVDIDETAITDVTPLVGLPIQRLIADYDEGIDMNTIAKLTTLKELSVSGCMIATLPRQLSNLHSLVKLNLSNNPFTSVQGLAGPIKNIRQLNLAKNHLDDDTDAIRKIFPNASIVGIQ